MSKILLFISIVTLSQLAFIKICESSAYLYHSCIDTYGNYTNNCTYKTNLNTLLYSISTNTQINYGFYNFSAGQDPNKVNGIALCRGDVTIEDCHLCLKNSTVMLPIYCPTQKEAIIWYDYCMLRYSSRSILGVTEENPRLILFNVANVSDQDQFKVALTNFLYSLQTQAASGDSQLKFATGKANVSSLYGFSQCTPDLSFTSCFNCLGDFIRELLGCCADKIGARVIGPSCIVRYEPSLFYNLVNASSPPPLPSPAVTPPLPYTNSSGNRGKGIDIEKAAIIITIPVVILSVAVAIIFCIILTKGKSIRRKVRAHEAEDDNVSLQFDFKTIRVATNNFSEDNKLGQGGFGTVYKGKLGNGQEIAVKRLSKGSKQGNQEFKTEVLVVAKLQHRNLVRLLGFGLKQEEKLLIYEFVANGSLDYYLFDSNKRNYLDWRKRYNIITGIARGTLYLHEDSRLRIIHRDLKASNVLLDEDMNPKIADFGTARLFEADQTQGDTSRIAGTYGYMAPEYALHGLFSVKSDVYSFGVLVLEIITGRKCSGLNNPGNTEDLLSYVWRNWREETVYNIVDPVLSKGSRNQIIRCINIGLLCVQETAEDRPSMSSVVLMLSSHSHTMPIPSNPAFVTRSGIAPYF